VKPKRIGDIELEHDDRLLRADWKVQHAGWWVFAAIILAGLLGAFGGGPLSRASFADQSAGFSVRYERIARWETAVLMRITLLPRDDQSQTAMVWIGNAYLEGAPVQWINPSPQRALTRADRTLYEFPIGAGQSGTITFEFRPERAGLHTLRIGRGEHAGAELSQFVLP